MHSLGLGLVMGHNTFSRFCLTNLRWDHLWGEKLVTAYRVWQSSQSLQIKNLHEKSIMPRH